MVFQFGFCDFGVKWNLSCALETCNMYLTQVVSPENDFLQAPINVALNGNQWQQLALERTPEAGHINQPPKDGSRESDRNAVDVEGCS